MTKKITMNKTWTFLVASIVFALSILSPVPVAATHDLESPVEARWEVRAGETPTGRIIQHWIPVCFDDTGTDEWPRTSSGVVGRGAIEAAIDSWNARAGRLAFYIAGWYCSDLYNDVYGDLPYLQFSMPASLGGDVAVADRYYNNGTKAGAPSMNDSTCNPFNPFCLDRTVIRIDGNIFWNQTHTTGTTPPSWKYDFISVVLHEIGHSLVIGHCDESGTPVCADTEVMHSSLDTGQVRRWLTTHAIADYTHLYD
jgi:hypothetical protein